MKKTSQKWKVDTEVVSHGSHPWNIFVMIFYWQASDQEHSNLGGLTLLTTPTILDISF